MLTARGLFAGLAYDDPHACISKSIMVYNYCLGRIDWDTDVIRCEVFSLSMTSNMVTWFNEIPYKSIYIWEQLMDVFLENIVLVSKKQNKKNKLNIFK